MDRHRVRVAFRPLSHMYEAAAGEGGLERRGRLPRRRNSTESGAITGRNHIARNSHFKEFIQMNAACIC